MWLLLPITTEPLITEERIVHLFDVIDVMLVDLLPHVKVRTDSGYRYEATASTKELAIKYWNEGYSK